MIDKSRLIQVKCLYQALIPEENMHIMDRMKMWFIERFVQEPNAREFCIRLHKLNPEPLTIDQKKKIAYNKTRSMSAYNFGFIEAPIMIPASHKMPSNHHVYWIIPHTPEASWASGTIQIFSDGEIIYKSKTRIELFDQPDNINQMQSDAY